MESKEAFTKGVPLKPVLMGRIMSPNGVAVFYRDHLLGDQPVHFEWGTDPQSIERAWNATLEIASASDPEELRQEGYFASLVCVSPLTEVDLGLSSFVDSCLRMVEIDVAKGECTSHAGNEWVTETLLEAKLASDRIRVPLAADKAAMPEFSAEYLDCLDEGDVEMSLFFALVERTSTHAIYSVQELDSMRIMSRGKMAPSSRRLINYQQTRKHG
jgi:hypothetical protein